MTDKMREEFEAAFVSEQVLRFGEGYRDSAVFMLKRSGDFGFDRAPTQYELNRRKDGLYDMHWVEMVWWAWQASREALVIELPYVSDALNTDHMFVKGYLEGLKDFREVVEDAGLKVSK